MVRFGAEVATRLAKLASRLGRESKEPTHFGVSFITVPFEDFVQ
jgi:hypothetical protein